MAVDRRSGVHAVNRLAKRPFERDLGGVELTDLGQQPRGELQDLYAKAAVGAVGRQRVGVAEQRGKHGGEFRVPTGRQQLAGVAQRSAHAVRGGFVVRLPRGRGERGVYLRPGV